MTWRERCVCLRKHFSPSRLPRVLRSDALCNCGARGRGNKAAAAVAPRRRRRRPSKCPRRLTPAAADGRPLGRRGALSGSRRRDLREDDPARSLSAQQIRSPTCAWRNSVRTTAPQKSRPPLCVLW